MLPHKRFKSCGGIFNANVPLDISIMLLFWVCYVLITWGSLSPRREILSCFIIAGPRASRSCHNRSSMYFRNLAERMHMLKQIRMHYNILCPETLTRALLSSSDSPSALSVFQLPTIDCHLHSVIMQSNFSC